MKLKGLQALLESAKWFEAVSAAVFHWIISLFLPEPLTDFENIMLFLALLIFFSVSFQDVPYKIYYYGHIDELRKLRFQEPTDDSNGDIDEEVQ